MQPRAQTSGGDGRDRRNGDAVKAVRLQVVGLTALAVGFACDRSPTEPPQAVLSAAPIGSFTGTGTAHHATRLVPCSTLPKQSVTALVGAKGGTIHVGPHTLFIPAGALPRTVAITAEIQSRPRGRAGSAGLDVNAVGFTPHLKFQTPAYLVLSYANCDPASRRSPLAKVIVYANEALNVIFEDEASNDSPDDERVTAPIDHFSNYAVAW
jgi:hypothetical protein